MLSIGKIPSARKTDLGKAELFNHCFQSVFSEIDYESRMNPTIRSESLNALTFSNEIQTAIPNMSINTVKGVDNISNAFLKNLAESIPKSLHMVFNLIAKKAAFPLKWKISVIVLISDVELL